MAEFYLQIRFAHILAVIASGSLFVLRGLGLFAGHRWPRSWPVRVTSYSVDAVLLTAAQMLMTVVQQYPFAHSWLTVKVILLCVYIALGYVAFWSGRSTMVRVACWIAGLCVLGYIVSVARNRHPLGFLALMLG
jgi:uncharacterized membrane protein SirB2